MKTLFFLLSLMLSPIAEAKTETTNANSNRPMVVDSTSASMTSIERRVRSAAVRVTTAGGGHGSGSVIQYKKFQFVLTAQHVADEKLGTRYALSNSSEKREGILVYSDEVHDIAVLWVPLEFGTIKPMKYKPMSDVAKIGTEIVYSGYPSHHDLMSFRGRIAGYEQSEERGTQMMLHSYGWFGCSGSVLYNVKGEIVGVLWGVDVERYPDFAIIEDMTWIVPIKNLDLDAVLKSTCVGPTGDIVEC